MRTHKSIFNEITLRALSLVLGASVLFAPGLSEATITFIGASGASRIDLTQVNKPSIYAGFAGSCPGGMDTSSTCDSCDGSGLKPCNKTNAYPTLRLSVQLNMGRADLTTGMIKARIGSSNEISLSVLPVINGNMVDVAIPWGDICAASAQNPSPTCEGSFSQTLSIGYSVSGEAPTYYDMQVIANYVNATTTSTFQICDETNDPEPLQGFCNYAVQKGDGKVYLDDKKLFHGSSFPASKNGGTAVPFQDLVVFYKPVESGSSRAVTLGAITNQSEMISLAVATTETPPVADTRIDGLTNDVDYCFVMANRDTTGNIYYYAPWATMPEAEICGMPAEVFGLLDDKKCFIATAAFGSEMAPEVQSFRDFRDKYLLKNSLGKSFVKFYYAHSPKFAKIMAQHDGLRATARLALWPLLSFAKLSLQIGLWPAFALLFTAIGAFGVGIRRFRKARS